MEWYFIVNPVAGRGRTGRLWPRLEALLRQHAREHTFPFRVSLTSYAGEAVAIARAAADEGTYTIVGVGGDGTTGDIVNGVLQSVHPDAPIGVVPTGTGNDFVRGQEVPLAPEAALKALLEGVEPVPVDVFEVKDDRGNSRYAINSIGIGFDAYVAHLAHSRRWLKRLGPLAYAVGAAGGLLTFRTTDGRVLLDGNVAHTNGTWLVACTNTDHLAGGMKICPGADSRDGKMNLCLVSGISPLRLLHLMILSFQGKHAGRAGVHLLSGREAVVAAARPLPVHIDGDPVPFQLPLTLRVLPGAVRLLVPTTTPAVHPR